MCALLALALAPATAQAGAPQITEGPRVAGTPQVGQTLRAEGAKWKGKPEPTASWLWIRCDGAALDEDSCRAIGGATATTYTAIAADQGKRLRVMLVLRNKDGSAWAISGPTGTVAAAPAPTPSPSPSPSPTPAPDPAPTPPPEPEPDPEPVVTPGPAAAPATPAAPAPAGEVLDRAAAAPRRMRPAPVVRIRGRLTRSGARITLLTVRAPRGARITLRCIGRGCPSRRWARSATLTRVARFQRALPAGTKLVITVTKPGRIGKHTTIVIRNRKAPRRRDRCLLPGARRPIACAKVTA